MMDFINSFWQSLQDLLSWLLDGLIYVLKAVLYFPFDGLLTMLEGFFNLLDFSALLFDGAATWSGLPDQAIYILNAIGFPQCLALIATALILRLTLNLIPSWATRV